MPVQCGSLFRSVLLKMKKRIGRNVCLLRSLEFHSHQTRKRTYITQPLRNHLIFLETIKKKMLGSIDQTLKIVKDFNEQMFLLYYIFN